MGLRTGLFAKHAPAAHFRQFESVNSNRHERQTRPRYGLHHLQCDDCAMTSRHYVRKFENAYLHIETRRTLRHVVLAAAEESGGKRKCVLGAAKFKLKHFFVSWFEEYGRKETSARLNLR